MLRSVHGRVSVCVSAGVRVFVVGRVPRSGQVHDAVAVKVRVHVQVNVHVCSGRFDGHVTFTLTWS